ncbi:ABC transporter ATP-binding protein [Pseudoduganella sp.]|uniref:ABC transporter ATP-binding protein n=1 Tax=Pseudoduganella sp. TaxID=1880898 RepID=UPI0035B284F9
MQRIALETADLSVRYGSTTILDGLNLRVMQGEIYALLGGNGAGKSTTLNAFLGFARAAQGLVRVCGIDVGDDPHGARASLAYVPENVSLYEHLSARENLEYLLNMGGAVGTAVTINTLIEAALTDVGLAREAWDRRLGAYSKGMRQKVAIALAVARAVPVLLLDEPTSGLDPHATSEFNALLLKLRAQGVTVFMVTHDLVGAAEVADRIGFLDRGRIAHEISAYGPQRFDVQHLFQRYADARRAA